MPEMVKIAKESSTPAQIKLLDALERRMRPRVGKDTVPTVSVSDIPGTLAGSRRHTTLRGNLTR